MLPDQTTSIWFQADSAGVYRGQCAEFCGYQHAKMAFLVVAEPPDRFATWLQRQRGSAATPGDSLARRGKEVFLASSCPLCHSVGGTPAGGGTGPDLTHLASRRTLAAGTLPNTRGHLAGWILDPQRIKPGAGMPPSALQPDELQALLAYLGSLR
jgi:cytochrome c oxidase subunit 2